MVKKILDTFTEKVIQDDRYNAAMLKYIEDAKEFANLSIDGISFMENLYWDTLMLKKYISASEIFARLAETGIFFCTFSEVKKGILNYADTHNIDITILKKAILLYEIGYEMADIKENNIITMAHNLGEIVGMSVMSKYDGKECSIILPFIDGDKSIGQYKENREIALRRIEQLYLVDKILDDIAYSYAVEMVNQVFDHYVSGIEAYSINVDATVMKKKRD